MEKAKKPFQDAHKSRSKSQRKSTYSRRLSANQKERRRTQNINSAFAELRRCIPNVPQDTKLSKIRTLRLATSYIGYLQEVLQEEQDRETKAETRSLSKPTRTVSLNSSRKYKPTIVSVKEEEKSEKTRNDVGSWPYYYTWNYTAHDSSPWVTQRIYKVPDYDRPSKKLPWKPVRCNFRN